MVLNTRDVVIAQGDDILVNNRQIKVTVYQGFALRGNPRLYTWINYELCSNFKTNIKFN